MSKIVLPRIATILEERNDRIADDLAEAEKLKRETDAAIAAYEQALAEARQKAHGIAQTARDKAKAELDRQRASVEMDLGTRMDQAERQIADVKARALADVDTIARDAASTIIETLLGSTVPQNEVADAVGASMRRGV
jgi:F-type H+-transporting ATPase subunit b